MDGTTAGLCLLPGESRIFKSFPGSVIPYIGLQRDGRSKIKIISRQMIVEPCPLLNLETNQCTNYEKRPTACKGYPFTYLRDNLSLESKCSYVQSIDTEIEYGKTEIVPGFGQEAAALDLSRYYFNIGQKLLADKKLKLLIFDCVKKEWVG